MCRRLGGSLVTLKSDMKILHRINRIFMIMKARDYEQNWFNLSVAFQIWREIFIWMTASVKISVAQWIYLKNQWKNLIDGKI